MADAPKFIARKVGLIIGGQEVTCNMRKVSLLPEVEEIDTSTFCDPGAREYGEVMWTLEIDVIQSFGDNGTTLDGLHDRLSPLSLTTQAFTLKTDKDLTDPTALKPWFLGECSVPPIPIIDAEISATSEFTLTFPLKGEPTIQTAAI